MEELIRLPAQAAAAHDALRERRTSGGSRRSSAPLASRGTRR
jgi:hypothetical protein